MRLALLFHMVIKELRHFVVSPIAYIIAGVFHALIGFMFYSSIVRYSRRMIEISGQGVLDMSFTPTTVIVQGVVISMGTVFVLFTPIITMRLVAEEKRSKTIEYLMTSPLPLSVIVIGKFLAAYIVYCTIILSTLYIPLVIDIFSQVEWPHVAVAYTGLLLLGSAMISVGVLASTLTERQVVAAVISLGMLVMFWFIGGGIGAASMRVTTFLKDVSLYRPFESMALGIIDLRDVFVLISYTIVMLFASHRVLDSERL